MKIIKFLKSPPSDNVLPLEKSPLESTSFFQLDPFVKENEEKIKTEFNKLEEDVSEWGLEQDKRLTKALRLIRLCAFLRGLNYPFTDKVRGHYIWCPYEHWID